MQASEESLENFKRYISRLFSVNIADPNVGIGFADDSLSLIGKYSSGALAWQEFAQRCEALLDSAPNEE
jgi:hypothetical protein